MKNPNVHPVIVVFIIATIIMACVIGFFRLESFNEETFQKGFDAGVEFQRTIGDKIHPQKEEEKPTNEQRNKHQYQPDQLGKA